MIVEKYPNIKKMSNIDIPFILHVLFIAILMSFPFWPKQYAKIGIWFPFAISLIWVFFDGCPMTRLHNDSETPMTLRIYRQIMPNMSEKLSSHINTALLVGITLLGHYNLQNNVCA